MVLRMRRVEQMRWTVVLDFAGMLAFICQGDFTYVLFPSVHYKEYLVTKINKTHLDPISLYDVHGLEAMLTREEMLVLERKYYSEDEYKERLMKVSEWSISSLCGVH